MADQRSEGSHSRSVPASPSEGRGDPPRWRVEEICGPGGEARIELDGDVYRLRITARRRLILTK
ncbi:hemin uptake protein HemP [Amorphus coralli]|uniref:hemin uptake protein HemP n=1 Tax=Amorphus coralli TaxID=340680 RepID=UPI001469EE45